MDTMYNETPRFAVRVDGRTLALEPARVSAMPFNEVWRGHQRPLDQTEVAWFATFDMTAPAAVEVDVLDGTPLEHVELRPREYGVAFASEGNTLRFTVDRPMQLSVEIGGYHRSLALFANPPEEPVDLRDPDLLYFGPGVHTAGLILPKPGQTVYLAEGAVVYGTILVYHADGVTVRGRGILDSAPYRRGVDFAEDGQEVIRGLQALGLSPAAVSYIGNFAAIESRDLLVEGITLRDSQFWAVNVHNNCEYVELRNVKIIGQWRYNSDGIDICASSHTVVRDCFVRAFDDCIITRPRHLEGDLDKMVDMRVENCVLWCDWGRNIEIWFGSKPAHVSDVVYSNCQIIRVTHIALDVQTWSGSPDGGIDGLTLENIAVELDDEHPEPQIQATDDAVWSPHPGYYPQLFIAELRETGREWKVARQTEAERDAVRMLYENVDVRGVRVYGHALPTSHIRAGGHLDAGGMEAVSEGIGADGRPHLECRRFRFCDITFNGAPLHTAADMRLEIAPEAEDIAVE